MQENAHQLIIDTNTDASIKPHQDLLVPRDSRLTYVAYYLGGTCHRKLRIVLEDGADAEIIGVFAGAGDDLFSIDITTEHKGKGSQARTLLHGVLVERAKVDFKGMIKILPSGNQTNAFLEERVMVLSEEAQSESLPSLEIEAQDVKASHAATTGGLHKEQLFYALSRGLPRQEAGRMLIEGFLRAPFLDLAAAEQEKVYSHIASYLMRFPLPDNV